jgi:tyrosinase
MALRKNQRWLTAWEKKYFTDAVLKLKAERKPGNTLSTYDQFVSWHQNNMDAGHFGPAFFAWHREFLRRFEIELQRIMDDKTLGLPYWDWSVDNSQTSSVWAADFMGGNGNASGNWTVTNGPFRQGNWELNVRDPGDPLYLRRQFGPNPGAPSSLPTPANVMAALRATPYDVGNYSPSSPSGFRNMAEGNIPPPGSLMHIRVHAWVGGNMSSAFTSPNDPVFWLHHCYMDKLWADWQAMHTDQYAYLPDGGARQGHNLNDRMAPWNEKRPADVLNTADLDYHYDSDDYLMANDVLYPSQEIPSASRRFGLTYLPSPGSSSDNNLVFRQFDVSSVRWVSTNRPLPDGWCVMQGDGNLVIYDWSNPYNAIWASNTAWNPRGYLWVRDGLLTMHKWDDGTPINWSVPPPSVGNPPKG